MTIDTFGASRDTMTAPVHARSCALPVYFDPAISQKPTLPDPNEVNGSVMADPFNMDHIKVTGISSTGMRVR